ncbi:unnamed protein product [Linum trigynum]|uniref:Nucleotide-diphospho-sugar transferase domain-containing protein n=1 Tax=Linum trigynum TaxID=586398 RepID=A0AAV2ESA5_9ROSI
MRRATWLLQDADVVWLRNPFPILIGKNKSETTEDFQISTDVYNGDPHSPEHLINTGFYYVRSNNQTIRMFESWYGRRDNSSKKEQDVLLEMSRGGVLTSELGVKTRYLDTAWFSGFCSDIRDVEQVVTVHANCCRSIIAKVKDLKVVIGDWKRWKMLAAHWKATGRRRAIPFRWTGHFGCWNSWNNHNVTTQL